MSYPCMNYSSCICVQAAWKAWDGQAGFHLWDLFLDCNACRSSMKYLGNKNQIYVHNSYFIYTWPESNFIQLLLLTSVDSKFLFPLWIILTSGLFISFYISSCSSTVLAYNSHILLSLAIYILGGSASHWSVAIGDNAESPMIHWTSATTENFLTLHVNSTKNEMSRFLEIDFNSFLHWKW